MNINLKKERYCYKCHKIKTATDFLKQLPVFRQSSVCIVCSKKR